MMLIAYIHSARNQLKKFEIYALADPPNEVDIESNDNNTSTQLTLGEAFSYYGMLTANIAIFKRETGISVK